MITGNERPFHGGLTIRQQFAMAAMQSLLAHPSNIPNSDGFIYASQMAVKCADLLIKELNKEL